MVPEAYTLVAAIDGWVAGNSGEQIRDVAAQTAKRLLVTDW